MSRMQVLCTQSAYLLLTFLGSYPQIRRTREVIERVEVEHVAEDGEPPVTTTAEQRVFKSTNMERGNQISDEAPQVCMLHPA
jgi:hypothetical protein